MSSQFSCRRPNLSPRITWQPVVLTFAASEKKPEGESNLDNARARLEHLDIKTLLPYDVGSTTHVVANKRNTAKGLQALINGKYIVTEAFIDAVAKAAAPVHNAEDPTAPLPSALEEDFDGNWPDPLQYLPEHGREPVIRPPEMFAPNPDRSEVFAGYTFIFCDSTQYETLEMPITNGGGKARLFQLLPGESTVDEIVLFARAATGSKSNGKGVIVVRFRIKKGMEDWAVSFAREIEKALGQQSIEQNEFLDAILMNDASALRKPLADDIMVESSFPAPDPNRGQSLQAESVDTALKVTVPSKQDIKQVSSSAIEVDNETKPPEPTATRRRVRRTITQSRFTGFDDFDPSQLPKLESAVEESQPVAEPALEEESQRVLVESSQPARAARKRRMTPIDPSSDDENVVDELLPAAAAMKRRRLAEGTRVKDAPAVEPGKENAKGTIKDAPKPGTRSKKKTEREVDILSAARSRREAADEAARQDAESLRTALDGMDIDTIKNLVQVEEMEVAPRKEQRTGGTGDRPTENWDERWNGRKNFKRFRRKGEGERPVRRPRVIVGFEEAKKKDFGIGDDYWNERSQNTGRRGTADDQDSGRSQAARQSQARAEVRERERHQQTPRSEMVPATDSTAHDDESPRGQAQRNSRSARNRQHTAQDVDTAQASTVHLSEKAKGKRPAASSAAVKAPPAKRARLPAAREESDESEDESKFRFRSRR